MHSKESHKLSKISHSVALRQAKPIPDEAHESLELKLVDEPAKGWGLHPQFVGEEMIAALKER
jgi:hypothetical protein